MGRFYLSYFEQENLLPRSFPPEIPYKSAFHFFILFVFIKSIPSAVRHYIGFTWRSLSSRLAILCATLKRQSFVRGTINKCS